MRFEKLCGALLFWTMSMGSVAAPMVTIPIIKTSQDEFAAEVLRNTLEDNQQIHYLSYHRELSTHGIIDALRYGDLSVAWLPASYTKRKGIKVIEHPIFKGAFSYYQVYVENGRHIQVKSINDLKSMTLGLRRGDGKSTDLRKKGLKVVEFPSIKSLPLMLQGNRFDAALLPVFAEHASGNTIAGLQPLDTIIAVFNPHYFVVSEDNHVMADEISKGLLKSQASGQFDETFYQTRWVTAAITELETEGYNFLTIDVGEETLSQQGIDRELLINLKPHQLLSRQSYND